METKQIIPIEECRRVIDGKTPHGGVRLEVYYFDDDNNLCRIRDASRTRIIEKDEDGNTIFEIYGTKP